MPLSPPELLALAQRHGTPLYAYALAEVRRRLAHARAVLPPATRLLYALKANPNAELLAAIAPLTDGVDVASAGELALARAAGATHTTLAGPGKTDRARAGGASVIVVESIAELDRLPAGQPILVRLNPATRVRTFAVSTTGAPSPFGIDAEELPALAEALHARAHRLDYRGVHVHAGSQCASARAYVEHVGLVLDLCARLAIDHQLPPREVCFGGGFGVAQSEGTRDIDLVAVGQGVDRALSRWTEVTGAPRPIPSFELGRWLVAEAGFYVTTVVATKVSRGERFAILDGGLHHLMVATDAFGAERPRPPITNASRVDGPRVPTTLVGPLCTPLDVLGRRIVLPTPEVGDRLVFHRVGAYGLTLSPVGFLSHDPPTEVLVP